MEGKGIDVSLVFEPDNQYYLTGFKAITYSRPILTVVTGDSVEMILPGLEELHAEAKAEVDTLHVYYEHPEAAWSGISYRDHLYPLLKKYGAARVGIEIDSVNSGLYTELVERGYEALDIGEAVKEMRYVKDANELRLIEEAGRLSDVALGGSLDNARVGISELEFDAYGDRILLEEAARAHPDTVVGYEDWTASGVKRSVMPHLASNTRKFQPGDVVIHSRQVWLDGYRAENERTFTVGHVSERVKDLFKVAVEAHMAGLETIRAGIPAKEVDLAARKIVQRAGYADYSVHRLGHGIGLSEHEEPYLRFDSELILQEGMCFTIEPGLYVPGVAGFRHSDTVVVTGGGARVVTSYARDVDELSFDFVSNNE